MVKMKNHCWIPKTTISKMKEHFLWASFLRRESSNHRHFWRSKTTSQPTNQCQRSLNYHKEIEQQSSTWSRWDSNWAGQICSCGAMEGDQICNEWMLPRTRVYRRWKKRTSPNSKTRKTQRFFQERTSGDIASNYMKVPIKYSHKTDEG